MDLHEMCSGIVQWAASCPEATVSVWLVSAILMAIQAFSLAKRLVYGNSDSDPLVSEVEVPVNVPYVPSDTIIKLVKLLKNHENGWELGTGYFDGDNVVRLGYGNLNFYLVAGKVRVAHNNVCIDLEQHSDDPNLDQYLLKHAYNARVRAERAKERDFRASVSRNAEQKASKELSNILETL